MIVTTWKGGTLGLRIGKENVRRFFDPSWKSVDILIEGKETCFPLSNTFWTTCPEIRGGPIPDWLHRRGLGNWLSTNFQPHAR